MPKNRGSIVATLEIQVCDRCGEPKKGIQTLHIVVDRRVDAAGSPDDEWEVVDLCAGCAVSLLDFFLDRFTYPQRKEWIDMIHKNCETTNHEHRF